MSQTSKKQLGDRGEALVATWLRQQGWNIVAQQWHCRWGELDLVAVQASSTVGVAFVEVKTRRPNSLDQGGRLAITPQKQQKLWLAAQQFLAENPDYADLPCRFDVALVVNGHAPRSLISAPSSSSPLFLVDYIEDAFQQ